jgi:hypothetical protein
MDLSKASIKTSRQHVVDSRQEQKKPQFTVYSLLSTNKSRQHIVDSRQEQKTLQYAVYSLLSTNKGVALVVALLVSLATILLIMSTAYFVMHSTSMSGAGKRYATASEAADGAIEVMKDAINLVFMGEPVSSLPLKDATPPCLVDAIFQEQNRCVTTLLLPGTDLLSEYKATITVMRLYASALPGNRIEFARAGGGAPSVAVYFRINTVVTGTGGTRAETSALYRYVL